jgi:hypothetical protein
MHPLRPNRPEAAQLGFAKHITDPSWQPWLGKSLTDGVNLNDLFILGVPVA